MPTMVDENFWTAVLCMLFARIREAKWRDQVLSLNIYTAERRRRLDEMLPFGSETKVCMCRDLHKALEERGVSSEGCCGQADLWLEDTDKVLLIESKITANRNRIQEDRYLCCLRTAPVFAGKRKAFFYAIPRRYLGKDNNWEDEFLPLADSIVTRGLLLWDDQLKETVKNVLCLQDWFLREFPS